MRNSTTCVLYQFIPNPFFCIDAVNNFDLLVNIVHVFVIPAGDVDLGDDAGLQPVHQLAQYDAVAERLLVRHVREPLSDHRLNPLLGFYLLFWFTLASALEKIYRKILDFVVR